ncbi:MAG: hypothetical protein ABR616_07820, partial [Dermatophilaceae bacterium]
MLEHSLNEGAAIAPAALVGTAVFLLTVMTGRAALVAARKTRPATVRRFARGATVSMALTALAATSMIGVITAPAATAAIVDPVAPCTADTVRRAYDVHAINVFVPYSRWNNDLGAPVNDPITGQPNATDGDPNGLAFVLAQDVEAVQNWMQPIGTPGLADRRLRPRPLVLRANAGECISVTLTNALLPPAANAMGGFLPQIDPEVSLHAFGVSFNPNDSEGSALGYNASSTVARGQSHTYYWVAPKSEGLYLFRDMAMPVGAVADGGAAEHGLYGGLAVQPAGARWYDPVSGAELSSETPAAQYASVATQSGDLYVDAVITVPSGETALRYRESVLLSQDLNPMNAPPPAPGEPPHFERFSINYGSEPEHKRIDWNQEQTWCEECSSEETVLSSWVYGDPGMVKLASGPGPWLPEAPEFAADPATVPGGL